MYKMTNVDYQILAASLRENSGYHMATKWYLDWEPLGYQYAFHHIPIKNSTFLAGIGCVSGDTLILSPDGTKTAIKELARRGTIIDVVAWDGKEFVPTKASQPFLKGRADLYEVVLSDGKRVRTTLEHKFLTPAGYEPLCNIRVGQKIGVLPTLDQPIRDGDGFRCSRKVQGSQESCSSSSRRHDARPPLGVDTYQSFLQRQVGALGCSHSNLFQDVLPEQGPEHTHPHQSFVRHSMKDFAVQLADQLAAEKFLGIPEIHEQSLGRSLQFPQLSLRSFSHLPPSGVFDFRTDQDDLDALSEKTSPENQAVSWKTSYEYTKEPISQSLSDHIQRSISRTFDEVLRDALLSAISSSCEYPFNSSYECSSCNTEIPYREIISCTYVGEGDFYDIVVPGPNSYVGNGIVHHNSGKTAAVTASNVVDCLTLPGFRALNASITAKQAELAFQMLDTWRENISRFSNMITDISLRPYPAVTFWNGSTYEFRTAGQGAKFIRGSEYDRINYDEPGLDPDGEAIRVLRGRLRGKRPDGSSRMARMDVTGTPTAAPWFRERFENGLRGGQFATPESLKFYRSMRITTYDNTHLTTEQIALIEAEYPPEMVAVEMRAEWPDFGISTFPHAHIQACVDRDMNDDMDQALRPDGGRVKAGYEEEEWPRVGVVLWKTPVKNGHLYAMAGDPGVDVPPRRNSPCIMVFDITKLPAEMVYFHWASGRGSYDPFLQSYKRAVDEYRPIFKGIDATGTQKALADLGFEKVGIQMDSIQFGGQKDELINSLLTALTSHDMKFPMIAGLISQLQNYNREDDKDVAQDLVMTLAQIAYAMRRTMDIQRIPSPKKSNFFDRLKRTTNSGRRR